MGLSAFFKKAAVTLIAGTAVYQVGKAHLERWDDMQNRKAEDSVLSEFIKSATPPKLDPRGGFNFDIGKTSFHVRDQKDYELLLKHLPIVDSKITFGKYNVSEDVLNANLEASLKFGLPLSLMLKIQGPESGFDPSSLNKKSRACGLGQFIPATLAEKTYRFAEAMGFEGAGDLVRRYDPNAGQKVTEEPGYKPTYKYEAKNEAAREKLEELCFDPRFNAHLKAQYLTSNIAKMQKELSDIAPKGHKVYPVTSQQVYAAHFGGENRTIRMIRDLQDPKKAEKPASAYFNKHEVKQNRPYFFTQDNKPRSLQNFFDNLADKKGLGRDVMPDMREWSIQSGEIIIADAPLLVSGLEKLSIDGLLPSPPTQQTGMLKTDIPLPPHPRPSPLRDNPEETKIIPASSVLSVPLPPRRPQI